MNKILVRNIFAAVFDKSVLDPLLDVSRALQVPKPGLGAQKARLFADRKAVPKPGFGIRFWGTEGTMKYVKVKGFSGESVVKGFDYDGRVKSLDRSNFVRILADASRESHLIQLKKEGLEPVDCVIVDLYAPSPKIFPESMDIGGMSLIRAAIKNYKNVALAFDGNSIEELAREIRKNNGSTTLAFRKKQAQRAAKFIVARTKLEATMFEKISPADLV